MHRPFPSIWISLAAVLPAAHITCLRLNSGIAILWKERISLPILSLLRALGDWLPFQLLEAAALLLAAILAVLFAVSLRRKGLVRALLRLLRRLACLLLSLLWLYLGIWYPLYFGESHTYEATTDALAASCEALIDRLNASDLSFPPLQELPAKRSAFPVWLRVGKLAGFCAFFTGEAYVDPDLPDCALPFVAMHERMHLLGYAGEGAANIAAWQACMDAGGAWADSAQLWALRCSMGRLRQADPARHASLLSSMDDAAYAAFLRCGGSYSQAPQPRMLQWLYSLLGISESVQDYDILAAYLAANMPQCYNDFS